MIQGSNATRGIGPGVRVWFMALLVWGCASAPPEEIPELTQDELVLRVEYAGDPLGQPVLEYELENLAEMPVCIGGLSELFIENRSVETRTQTHVLCGQPLRVVPPGESLAWRREHRTLTCVEDWPEELRDLSFGRECGGEVEVHAKVMVFRMARGRPLFGGTWVQSEVERMDLQPVGDRETD